MKTKISIYIISMLFTTSCSIPSNTYLISKNNNQLKEISKNFGSSIQMKININSFSNKAIQDGSQAYKVEDIKSFKVWLCTNASAPESSKVQGSEFSFNRNLTSDLNLFTFVNIQPSPQYFAVVSAYKETVETGLLTNLNKKLLFEIDGNKNLSLSSNSIEVTQDFKLNPSNAIFNVNISLQDSKDSLVETQITPIDGLAGIFAGSQV